MNQRLKRASNHAPDEAPGRAGDRGTDRAGDRGTDRAGDRGTDRAGDRGADRAGDRGTDRAGDRGTDPPGDRGTDPGPTAPVTAGPTRPVNGPTDHRPAGALRRRGNHPPRSPRIPVLVLAGVLLGLAALSGCSWNPARALRQENARLAEEVRVLGNKLDELSQVEAETQKIRATVKQLQAEFDSLAASHPEAARRVREATMNR